MKKLVIGLVVLVIVVIVVVVAAPFFIPVDTYRQIAQEQAKSATGRELTIAGDMKLSLFPNLALEANDVTFANAEGGEAKNMAELKKLVFNLQVLPLLSGQVQLDSLVLVDPVIHLEVAKDGTPNWQFGPAAAGAAAPAEGGGGGASGMAIQLGDVRLVNGLVTYNDMATGRKEEVSKINLTLSLPRFDGPLAADGGLVWAGEQTDLDVKAGNLKDLMEGRSSNVTASLSGALLKLAFDGQVANGAALKVDGTVDLDVPSIRQLADKAGQPIAMQGDNLGPLAIKGKLAVDGPVYAFKEAAISVDAISGNGDFTADLGGAKPAVTGRLALQTLDLNPYMPPEAEAAAQPAEGAPAAQEPWSEEPIDVSGLQAANVDLTLSAEQILMRKIKVGKSALAIKIQDGKLTADLQQLALYDGNAKGVLAVDGSGATPALNVNFDLSGVQALPLLTDANDFSRLEGTTNAKMQIAGAGQSQRALVEALNGDVSFEFLDGAIVGVNLGGIVRKIGEAGGNVASLNPTEMFNDLKTVFSGGGENEKTDFARLGGTFKITKGIMRGDDLCMIAPLVQMTGATQKGGIAMPPKTLDYRIWLAPANAEVDPGEKCDHGKGLAVDIDGPWNDPKIQPDMAALMSGTMQGIFGGIGGLATGAAGGLGKVGEGAAGAVGGVVGGAAGAAGGAASGATGAIGNVIKDVTGGSTTQPAAGGTEAQPAEAPAKQDSGGIGGLLKGVTGGGSDSGSSSNPVKKLFGN